MNETPKEDEEITILEERKVPRIRKPAQNPVSMSSEEDDENDADYTDETMDEVSEQDSEDDNMETEDYQDGITNVVVPEATINQIIQIKNESQY